MFEPLLGLLTRGYAMRRVLVVPRTGCQMPWRSVAFRSNATMFEPPSSSGRTGSYNGPNVPEALGPE